MFSRQEHLLGGGGWWREAAALTTQVELMHARAWQGLARAYRAPALRSMGALLNTCKIFGLALIDVKRREIQQCAV